MSKSKVIRASEEVLKYLKDRRIKDKEPWDSVMRRMLGLPDRKGNPQVLKSFWVLTKPEPQVFKYKKDARGEAILRAIKLKKKRPEKPKKVIEVK